MKSEKAFSTASGEREGVRGADWRPEDLRDLLWADFEAPFGVDGEVGAG